MKLELREAFQLIFIMLPLPFPLIIDPPPPKYDQNGELEISFIPVISNIGFELLLKNGTLMGIPRDKIFGIFSILDVTGRGCVCFEEIWPWFLDLINKKNTELAFFSQKKTAKNKSTKKENKKDNVFSFKSLDIVTVADRSTTAALLR